MTKIHLVASVVAFSIFVGFFLYLENRSPACKEYKKTANNIVCVKF